MILFPNCKINLGLNIIRKREDGYHDLETVFYPIFINDILEIITNNTDCSISNIKSHELKTEFSCSGLPIEGDEQNNLCIKAYHLLKNDFPSLPSIKMHLHKNIPMGAGLGGGSSDGAFTLKLLNNKFSLNLSDKQLCEYALQLGSDCPFFIINQPCYASSRGEIMEKVSIDLSKYAFLVINPGIHISTSWAFSNIAAQIPVKSIKEIIHQPVSTWKSELINDFEEPVMKKYPKIKHIKDQLYNQGALYVSMTGSGSTLYGIFVKGKVPELYFEEDFYYSVYTV